MMDQVIECIGDPRAMGLCQGLALEAEIRDRVLLNGGKLGRRRFPTLRGLTSGARLGQGTGREIIRHYTHLAERMAGIARNADVELSVLMDLLCHSTSGASPGDELIGEAVVFGASGVAGMSGGGLVLRTLSGDSLADCRWFVRKSVPEVGFKSVEVTLPWLATSVAGVNEAGISVAVAPRSDSYGGGVNAGAVNARHAPHAVLLVQECLQRFDSLEGCVDWCSKRPRSGNVSLAIGDPEGRLVQVEVEGDDFRVAEAAGGMVLDGASPEISSRLREHYREHKQVAPDVIADLARTAGSLLVYLESSHRRLSIRSIPEDGEGQRQIEFSL
jgi:hypothetical protein